MKQTQWPSNTLQTYIFIKSIMKHIHTLTGTQPKYSILYTHRAQSYQNNLQKVLNGNACMHARTHTHAHNDSSRNWVPILVGDGKKVRRRFSVWL